MAQRLMKPIPIDAAADIAKTFGYDQVIVIARRVGEPPAEHGEHVTTYGVNAAHCSVAAKIGDFLKYKIMGWKKEETTQHEAAFTKGVTITGDITLRELVEATKRSRALLHCDCDPELTVVGVELDDLLAHFKIDGEEG